MDHIKLFRQEIIGSAKFSTRMEMPNGHTYVENFKAPLHEGCRWLIAKGYADPEDQISMYVRDDDTNKHTQAFSVASVGHWAGLMVAEGAQANSITTIKYRPFEAGGI